VQLPDRTHDLTIAPGGLFAGYVNEEQACVLAIPSDQPPHRSDNDAPVSGTCVPGRSILALSGEGDWLLTRDDEHGRVLKKWSLVQISLSWSFAGNWRFLTADISRNGKLIALVNWDRRSSFNQVDVLDFESGRIISSVRQQGRIRFASFDDLSRILLTA